ncbi:hypothetical protein DHD32_05925 [Arenibacter sp. TNZ]|uniref:iron chaperone n=1 Tax=Arenibacter TaxID=178469 RepID=UPI000CD3FB39|nr:MULTISPECIES: DUF1801 domain-containing protein [Arenibacter]MCM4171007.1 hypothetical protein [Arenibacter sp. TNZ]
MFKNGHKSKGAENDVTTYIAHFPSEVQEVLEELRSAIKKAAPGAEELISYKMPAYKFHGILVYFAAYKNHIGFYATPTGHKKFEKDLAIYKQGKGSVQFPLNKPMPLALISKIVKFRFRENMAKAQNK